MIEKIEKRIKEHFKNIREEQKRYGGLGVSNEYYYGYLNALNIIILIIKDMQEDATVQKRTDNKRG